MTIVLVQATITATRFAIEKRPRLRLIRRSRGFDQYTDQYQKISGWTQWTRQLFVPTENGAKSAGKHPIAGLLRPDASSHAGGHWFESSSLHHKNNHTKWCGYFYGIRGNLKCSTEVNSASAKVSPAAKRLYGATRRPAVRSLSRMPAFPLPRRKGHDSARNPEFFDAQFAPSFGSCRFLHSSDAKSGLSG